jgi:hypothetical protein
MLDLETGKIGCPNGHANPIPTLADRGKVGLGLERRVWRGWRWLKRRLGLDGDSERRSARI